MPRMRKVRPLKYLRTNFQNSTNALFREFRFERKLIVHGYYFKNGTLKANETFLSQRMVQMKLINAIKIDNARVDFKQSLRCPCRFQTIDESSSLTCTPC